MSCINRSTSEGVARAVRPVCAGLGAGQRSVCSTAPGGATLSFGSPFARLAGLYNMPLAAACNLIATLSWIFSLPLSLARTERFTLRRSAKNPAAES
jgi:hypothetical protein